MKEQFKAEFKRLMDRTDELSLRERALVFIGILVVLYLVAANLVFAPLTRAQGLLEKQLVTKREQLQTIEQQIQSVVTGSAPGTQAEKLARLEALNEELKRLEQGMAERTAGLVSPKEMARLVEGFLRQNQRLRVARVESLLPTPLTAEAASTGAANQRALGRAAVPVVYSHGMRMEIEGRYLDILDYLKALEGLPWKVFWGKIALEAEPGGTSKVTLMIYTLSTREGWIGI